MDKRGQITIFIILGIIIVGGILIYFLFRGSMGIDGVSTEFEPVYDLYLSCLEDTASQGVSLLGEQAGYIEPPEFEPGSAYSPTSSQLDFLGQGVPYWLYVSGNNILREQVPSKEDMEGQLEKYIEERVDFCDFSVFEQSGYDIFIDPEARVDVTINELEVDINLDNKVTIFKENSSVEIDDHRISLDSKLGKYYSLAREVYDYELEELFLEDYAIDVMRLYAPVDGIEVSCVPKIFNEEEIRTNLVNGLVANIHTLKLEGDYYDLREEGDYFVTDSGVSVDENVNFMYNPNWPTRIEMYGDRISQPIGLQKGLSAIGFCYVPYHFVYDINFPVLVQFFDEENFFQFPVGVVIQKSQAREALLGVSGISIENKVCQYNNQEVVIKTYDIDLSPVESFITFKCLDATCNIGETVNVGDEAVLNAGVPQCVNGFIVARAEGYAEASYLSSTNEISSVDIILNKKYNISLDLGNVDATVTFDSEDYSTTAVYPNITHVELIEGFYNITVYIYDDSSLVFPAINDRKCVDVPESGIAGVFGIETEKCYDINIPATEVDFAVIGGGKTQEYITVDQLKESSEINIVAPLFDLPNTLDGLQENYIKVEDEKIFLEFE